MHIHAFGWDHRPGPPNPLTGRVPAARTDKEAMEASLAELRRYNVVRAVAGGRSEHVAASPPPTRNGSSVAP